MILDGRQPDAIDRAARALAAGELVGLPTETVYGLAADADNDAAVRTIFAAKGRPSDHPLIVHVVSAADAARFTAEIPALAHQLIETFWPGPLTLILPRRAGVAEAAAAGQPTIAVRSPAHPVAQALLAACAARGIHGLAAPSANRFGRVSPTTATHVAEEFGGDLLVLDGGACAVGIESAIIDLSRGAPALLRPGQLGRAEIEAAADCRLQSNAALSTPAPRAPGTLPAHYAPRAKLRLMAPGELRIALELLGDQARHLAIWSRTPPHPTASAIVRRRMPDNAAAAAAQLFAVLRDFDAAGVKLIWVETPPADDPAWDGVRDRLERAAAS
jgi:L-threonylcarbamoyladenylate synthase